MEWESPPGAASFFLPLARGLLKLKQGKPIAPASEEKTSHTSQSIPSGTVNSVDKNLSLSKLAVGVS
jgi:hypothetical protein